MYTLALLLFIGLVLGGISRFSRRLFPQLRFPEGALFFTGAALIAFIALGRSAENWGDFIIGGWLIGGLCLIGYGMTRYVLRR
jgi:hypothetical protein